jgi:hypothetical protein
VARGGRDGGESSTMARGGRDGGESNTVVRGGRDGGESRTVVRGGRDGGESGTAARGGSDGGESVNAKAELASAQPAAKAIRLTFIVNTPIVVLTRTESGTPRHGSSHRYKRHEDPNPLMLPRECMLREIPHTADTILQ